jgi:hypothetical protein
MLLYLLKEECEVNTKIALIIFRNVCFGSWQVMSKKNAKAATCSKMFSLACCLERYFDQKNVTCGVCLK